MIMERKCANCANGTWCDGTSPITDVCIQCRYVDVNGKPQPSNWKPQPMTNGDRIRAMSDEELAESIAENANTGVCNDFDIQGKEPCQHNCKECVLEWLKQPAEVE